MSRRPIVGDVFEAPLDAASKRYFQYVCDDRSQLNSNVVRVFRKNYDIGEALDVQRVLGGEIDFHVHVLLPLGLKQRDWSQCGNAPPPEKPDVLFRNSGDYGDPSVRISRDWFVWKIDGPHIEVGELSPKYQAAEIGIVVDPSSVLHRMRTGKYDFFYPDY